MNFSKIFQIVLAAVLTIGISAHTKRTLEEMVQYRRHIARNAELLNACLETPELKQLSTRIQAKRQKSLRHIRKARGISVAPRDSTPFLTPLQTAPPSTNGTPSPTTKPPPAKATTPPTTNPSSATKKGPPSPPPPASSPQR
ncbi:hypothetical protein GRF29_1g3202978 [Pseudopithomyces chartarum]|uniref:Uncharacterized protein n=1 Tax=Pseudopithomyces chartarum TaxID=1892770 RepID=A0AAN6RN28_9PLEO|nr:hypothetical protein GRF29_1g3202978 [Pseudopithomyces chartarum]